MFLLIFFYKVGTTILIDDVVHVMILVLYLYHKLHVSSPSEYCKVYNLQIVICAYYWLNVRGMANMQYD